MSGLVERGHTVTAYVHVTGVAKQAGVTEAAGDIRMGERVVEALEGADLVVSTLGSWGTKHQDILSTGMSHIIPAMESRQLLRIVSLTGADANAPGDTQGLIHHLAHRLFLTTAPRIMRDSERHIQLLSDSRLDWTVLRSPVMTETGDAGRYQLSRYRPYPWQTVHRASVARALVDLLDSTDYSQAAPYIART